MILYLKFGCSTKAIIRELSDTHTALYFWIYVTLEPVELAEVSLSIVFCREKVRGKVGETEIISVTGLRKKGEIRFIVCSKVKKNPIV